MNDATQTSQPPKLSELGQDLLKLSRWQIARALAVPFLAFFAYWIFAMFGLWIPAVLSLVVLSFVTYGSTSHDLVHGSLGLNRRWNGFLLSIIEAMSLRSGHAYQLAHLHHHARFPHEDDIEAEAAKMSLLRALWEGVIFQFRIYVWALRNPRGKRGRIVTEGLVVLALVLTAILSLPWTIIPAIYVALMIAGSWIIPLVTSYIPHDATAKDSIRQTRIFRGWFFRILAMDHLYHWEHHLYPAVPHQNWPRLAKRLDPWIAAKGIEPVKIVG